MKCLRCLWQWRRLAIYVCIPAWIAALAFRGGLVLWMAGVSHSSGETASGHRGWRVFWAGPCGLEARYGWQTLGPVLISHKATSELPWGLSLSLLCVLAAISGVLPNRGLPDRLAGKPGPCRGSPERTANAPR